MFTGRKSDVLASNNDRDEAASLLRRHHEEGRLSEEEFEERLAVVRSAKTLGDLEPVDADLPSLGFENRRTAEHKLASDSDRERARTKLRQHHGEGRIGPDEFDDRMSRASIAKTQAEIDLLFRDLPSLAPAATSRIPSNHFNRADDQQRDEATAKLRRHRNAGRLSQEEFDARAIRASTAETPAVLAELLSDLPKLGPGGSIVPGLGGKGAKVRASDHDRATAVRKLRMHADRGDFSNEPDDECARRTAIVESATTPHEIEAVFSDLPELTPARTPRRNRLVADHDRDDAIRQLTDHLAKGRLSVDEHRVRVDQVRAARDREEIKAAFRGLPRPGAAEAFSRAKEVADDAGDMAAEGARRVKEAVKWAVLSMAVFVGAIVMLFANQSTAGVLLIISIGLLILAVRALGRGKPRSRDDRGSPA